MGLATWERDFMYVASWRRGPIPAQVAHSQETSKCLALGEDLVVRYSSPEYLFPSPTPNKWTFSLASLRGPGDLKRQVGVGRSGASRKRQKGRLRTSHKDHRILVR